MRVMQKRIPTWARDQLMVSSLQYGVFAGHAWRVMQDHELRTLHVPLSLPKGCSSAAVSQCPCKQSRSLVSCICCVCLLLTEDPVLTALLALSGRYTVAQCKFLPEWKCYFRVHQLQSPIYIFNAHTEPVLHIREAVRPVKDTQLHASQLSVMQAIQMSGRR